MLRTFSIISALLMLSTAAHADYSRAFSFKAKVKVTRVGEYTYRIMEHKREANTIMVTPSAGNIALGKNGSREHLRKGAVAYVSTIGDCSVSQGQKVINLQYEFTYSC